MTSVSYISDIFRGEAVDLNQNKQDDVQSARGAISKMIQSILGSVSRREHAGSPAKVSAALHLKQQQT